MQESAYFIFGVLFNVFWSKIFIQEICQNKKKHPDDVHDQPGGKQQL